jgi:hypothetical protein
LKKRNVVAVCLAAIVLLVAMCSSASAQEGPPGSPVSPVLIGQWFKLKAKVRGYSVGMDETASKWRTKFDAYLYLDGEGDNESAFYYYLVVCEVEPDIWEVVTSGELRASEAEGIFFLSDMFFAFVNPDGTFINNYTTSIIKTKVNRFGELKKANFRTLGSEVYWGIDASDNSTLFGRTKIKGKLIDPEKLPFDLDNETLPEPI